MSSEFRIGPRDDEDRIRLGPAVASGTEGVLYRGFLDSASGEIALAVKMLQPGHLDRLSVWTTRWREQVDLLRRVQVPGLVRVRGGFVGGLPHLVGRADQGTSSLYLLMDWVEGVPLDRWARSVEVSEAEQLLLALVPVAAALDMLHSGAATDGRPVVHRDVKPANILVRPAGDTVLVDVGSVRGLGDDSLPSGVVGTPGYMAPEVRDVGLYGPASDRYSLGAVGFFLLTGSDPPLGATSKELDERLHAAPLVHGRAELADHVLAMLDPVPERRPGSLANWVAQLRRSSLVALPGQVALPPLAPARHPSPGAGARSAGDLRSPRGRASAKVRARRRIALASGTVLAAMAVALAAYATGGQQPKHLAGPRSSPSTSETSGIVGETSTTFPVTTTTDRRLPGSPAASARVVVPNVVGHAATIASTILERAGLKTATSPPGFSGYGVVTAMSPAAGVKAPYGSVVTITVANGAAPVEPAQQSCSSAQTGWCVPPKWYYNADGSVAPPPYECLVATDPAPPKPAWCM
jgi:serine/threonine protein kinase